MLSCINITQKYRTYSILTFSTPMSLLKWLPMWRIKLSSRFICSTNSLTSLTSKSQFCAPFPRNYHILIFARLLIFVRLSPELSYLDIREAFRITPSHQLMTSSVYYNRIIFLKTNISSPLIRTRTCVSWGKKCYFFGKFCKRAKWMIPIQKCNVALNHLSGFFLSILVLVSTNESTHV